MTADPKHSPATAALLLVLEPLLADIKAGRLTVARFIVADEAALELSFSLVVPAEVTAAPAPASAQGDPTRRPCPSCGKVGSVNDCGTITLPAEGGTPARTALDLMCLACDHRWREPLPEG